MSDSVDVKYTVVSFSSSTVNDFFVLTECHCVCFSEFVLTVEAVVTLRK